MQLNKLKEISIDYLDNIALGGAFLGTGGGGDPYIGKLLAREKIKEFKPVKVIDVDELEDDALVVPVAMMGAPTVLVEKLYTTDQGVRALRALEDVLGSKADAIFCIEAGGMNSTTPIALAAELGLPLVDGDGMGRAFPELQMVSMTMHGIKATPMAATDEKGNSMVFNAIDNPWTERLARACVIEMGGSAMTALYPMSGKQAKKATLRGTLSLIETIGRTIFEEQAQGRNPSHRLARELGGYILFEGRVADVERKTEGGFAKGKCQLHGLGDFVDKGFALDFQNEFLMATHSDGRPAAMTPDLISLLDLETGEPITTEQLRFGVRVQVLGLPSDAQWRTPAGIKLTGPAAFGYDMAFKPVEELNKA